jgi:hypothetical protein
MSQAASQAAAFYRDVAKTGLVWTVRDASGFPAPAGTSNKRAMPFWSSRARAAKIVATVPAYAGFEIVELTVEVFKEKWLPGLENDGLLASLTPPADYGLPLCA